MLSFTPMNPSLYTLIDAWPAQPTDDQCTAFAEAWAHLMATPGDSDEAELTVMTAAGNGQLCLLEHMARDLSPELFRPGLAPAAAGGHQATLAFLLAQTEPLFPSPTATGAYHGLAVTWATLHGQWHTLKQLLQSGRASAAVRCQAAERCENHPDPTVRELLPLLTVTLSPADWQAHRAAKAFGSTGTAP